MATKQDFKAAQQRILSRPRSESKTDQDLVRKTEDDGVYPSPLNVKAVRLSRLTPDPNRPPRAYSDESLAGLGRSLAVQGQLVPIVIQYLSDDDTFVIVDGERRWRAAQQIGWLTLQAIIVSRLGPEERYEQQMAAELHHASWSPAERLQALQSFKAMHDPATWSEAAQRLGLSEPTLDAMLQSSAAPAEEATSRADAAEQASAAMQLLERILSRVEPGKENCTDIMDLLDELGELAAAQRTRLEQASKPPVDNKQDSSKGKPVRNMPTWG